jgi:hypothetical protein
MADSNLADYSMIPELGDLVTFISDVYGRTYGRIVYRDGSMIRVRPYTSTNTAVDFPLDPESGLFLERLGVSEVQIHEKRADPHYSIQLSLVPGEGVEFFGSDGKLLSEPGIIHEVIATMEYDAIKLENGIVVDFGFIGPKPPIIVVRGVAAPEAEVPQENNGAEAPAEDELFPELEDSDLPPALVEEIPSEDRTYSDAVQREEMFVSFLSEIPVKRQKDPKIMQRLYRETDLLLGLKNSVLPRDETGALIPGAPSRSYIANTVQDSLEKQSTGAPLSSVIPVINTKKVLYVSSPDEGEHIHVDVRSDTKTLVDISNAGVTYTETINEGGMNPYILYLNNVLRGAGAYTPGSAEAPGIKVDQDILRSAVPPVPVEGFPKVPAAYDKKKQQVDLTLDHLGQIQDRHVRLLASNKIMNPRTRTYFTVAPADSAEAIANILLSPEMAERRAPTRSSVLLWDIQASERSRAARLPFYKSMMTAWTDQTVLIDEPMPIAPLLEERLYPSLAFVTQSNIRVLDSLGLRYLELTQETFAPLMAAVTVGTAEFDQAYTKLRDAAIVSLENPSLPTIVGVVDESSTLMSPASFKPVALQTAYNEYKERETSLRNYDLALANHMLKGASSTLGPYWYAAVVGEEAPELLASAERTYVTEFERLQRTTENVRTISKEFSAAPVINPCAHVKELEKIRSIRNDGERMIMFEKFMKQYQAGQQGNYVLCGSCGKDLVCRHELLLLNEYLNPGRGVALHKALLLEFAGPVFEGAYICRNCGQKIAELEYDTHLEFDDEGRPLVGRTAIAEEEDELENAVAIRAEAERDIPFTGEDRDIYFNLRTLFERCGMAMDGEAYERSVKAAKAYMKRNMKSAEDYEKLRAYAKQKFKRDLPPYITEQAETQIKTIGALVVLELQTSTINIPIPAGGCKLSRDGFPLDRSGDEALTYVSCALADIKNLNPPWSKTSWSPETRTEVRRSTVKNLLLGTIHAMLCIPTQASAVIPPPVDFLTEVYKARLETTRERKASSASNAEGNVGLPSLKDSLPPSYRPLPVLTAPSAAEETPIKNVAQFKKNLESGDIVEVGTLVKQRHHQLVQSLMADFHTASKTNGVILQNNPRSDSVCCFKRIGEVSRSGFGVRSLEIGEAKLQEAALIDDAAHAFTQRDPALPSAGTHMYVPWSAPSRTTLLPSMNPDDYYKLFLKHCYLGSNRGLTHEFSLNNRCRHCEFSMPDMLLYPLTVDISDNDSKSRTQRMAQLAEERKAAILVALNKIGIEINTESFLALESAIRRRHGVPPVADLTEINLVTRMLTMLPLYGAFLPSMTQDWESFTAALNEVLTTGKTGLARTQVFMKDFAKRYKDRGDALNTAINKNVTNADSAARNLEKMKGLLTITENTGGSVCVRNLMRLFVTGSTQIATKFANNKPNPAKWFPSITLSHKQLLEKIWKEEALITQRALDRMNEFDEGDTEIMGTIITALDRFSNGLGAVFSIWSDEFRPGRGMTEEEYKMALRWTILSGLLSLLTPSSPLYAGSKSANAVNAAIEFSKIWILDALDIYSKAVTKYQLTPDQVQAAEEARAEMERNMFIADMDKQEREGRKLELIKKGLGIGKWAASRILSTLNPEGYEFEREQRARMGLPEFDSVITGLEGGAAAGENPYGFMDFGEQAVGMEDTSNHRARQDEDE